MKTSTLETLTLHRLPGLQEELDSRLREAIRDCTAKSQLKKARVVRVELHFTPAADDENDIFVEPRVSSKFPTQPLKPITARRTRGNQLQFDFDDEDQV